MIKIFYSLLLLAFTCTLAPQAQAEEKMPSWEGIYCNKAIDTCMRIYEQGVNTVDGDRDYAQILFFTEDSSMFITEGELRIDGADEAHVSFVQITPSEDRKSMKVTGTPYFASWGEDTIDNYGDAVLLGEYTRMP